MGLKYSLREILLGVTSVAFFPAAYILIDFQQDLPSWCFADTCIDANRSMQPLVRKDLAIFYILLFLTAITIVLARKSRVINHFLLKQVFKTSSITIAELGWFCVLLLTLAASFGWNINYWWFRRLAKWTKAGKPLSTLVPQTLFNASGDVLSVILGFVMLPVSKNSFLATFLNLPYTSLMRLHIWLGRFLFCGSVFHGGVGVVLYIMSSKNLVQTLFIVPAGAVLGSNDYQQVLGIAAFAILLFVAIMSLNYFRRHFYNTFFFTHFFVFAFITVAYFHASSTIFFLVPGLCLYTIDGFTRLSSRFSLDFVSSVIFEECGYITVTVSTRKVQNARPGQFMRVNIPSISQFEFHPWSIVRATDSSVTFLFEAGHIDREWSAKVAEKLKQFDKSSKIAVNLQGPYGKAIEVTRAAQDLVLFYVGGTGIAASIQAIDGVLARNDADVDNVGKTKVVLVWSARRENITAISLLKPWKNVSRDVLELELFQTNGSSKVDAKTPAEELRMNLTSNLKKHVALDSESTDLNVGVFICGPHGFTKDALRNVSAFAAENPKLSLEVEVESFNL
ncbi:hypothetical protein HK100_000476 [Physocladia obscura]|uniref:FAD-binding FR-type domain-containing protein n=1 Tax=Physocladia obscura TaxID=109957 RepID=A0AAD5SYB5_9FUNG|nr:hypothetical protein HK100_000476 [Physocladia obscura]